VAWESVLVTADSRSPEPEPRGSKAAESLWAFSLEIYGRPGVAPACLSLQDRRGTDVNLLLHALWCGARGHFMTLEEHQQTRRAVTPWNENVVRPLRHARRWMKESAAHENQAGAALRDEIKRHELEAERLEQCLLEAALAPPAVHPPSPAVAVHNILGVVPEPSLLDCRDLRVLLGSLWPESGPAELEAHLRPS